MSYTPAGVEIGKADVVQRDSTGLIIQTKGRFLPFAQVLKRRNNENER